MGIFLILCFFALCTLYTIVSKSLAQHLNENYFSLVDVKWVNINLDER